MSLISAQMVLLVSDKTEHMNICLFSPSLGEQEIFMHAASCKVHLSFRLEAGNASAQAPVPSRVERRACHREVTMTFEEVFGAKQKAQDTKLTIFYPFLLPCTNEAFALMLQAAAMMIALQAEK